VLRNTHFIFICFLLTFAQQAHSRDPWPANPKGQNIPLKGFESSGTVYDPSTNLIYVVDDQGSIASLSLDGKNQRYVKIEKGLDMEAIATLGNGSGYLYVGIERRKLCYFDKRSIRKCDTKRAQIWEIDIKTLKPTNRKWALDMKTGLTKGLEGLTWIPNGSHPYGTKASGGVFYASSQKNGHIYVYEIDFDAAPNTTHRLVSNIDKFQPFKGYFNNDISDLYFDPNQKLLYALYDDKNKLVEINTSGKQHNIIKSYALPGKSGHSEGVTLLPNCFSGSCSTQIYLTDDRKGKGLYTYDAFPISCSETEVLASHTNSKHSLGTDNL